MAKELVKSYMPVGSMQTLITEKDKSGKYGRILGKFKVLDIRPDRKNTSMILNDFMIEKHYAVAYHGQSKDDVEAEHLENRKKLDGSF